MTERPLSLPGSTAQAAAPARPSGAGRGHLFDVSGVLPAAHLRWRLRANAAFAAMEAHVARTQDTFTPLEGDRDVAAAVLDGAGPDADRNVLCTVLMEAFRRDPNWEDPLLAVVATLELGLFGAPHAAPFTTLGWPTGGAFRVLVFPTAVSARRAVAHPLPPAAAAGAVWALLETWTRTDGQVRSSVGTELTRAVAACVLGAREGVLPPLTRDQQIAARDLVARWLPRLPWDGAPVLALLEGALGTAPPSDPSPERGAVVGRKPG